MLAAPALTLSIRPPEGFAFRDHREADPNWRRQGGTFRQVLALAVANAAHAAAGSPGAAALERVRQDILWLSPSRGGDALEKRQGRPGRPPVTCDQNPRGDGLLRAVGKEGYASLFQLVPTLLNVLHAHWGRPAGHTSLNPSEYLTLRLNQGEIESFRVNEFTFQDDRPCAPEFWRNHGFGCGATADAPITDEETLAIIERKLVNSVAATAAMVGWDLSAHSPLRPFSLRAVPLLPVQAAGRHFYRRVRLQFLCTSMFTGPWQVGGLMSRGYGRLELNRPAGYRRRRRDPELEQLDAEGMGELRLVTSDDFFGDAIGSLATV